MGDIMLAPGREYTRMQSHRMLGGGVQEYLPSVGGRIVCGCFRQDVNPLAPDVVFAGAGPRIRQTARWLCEQGGSIPVFLKRGVNRWQYVGDYSVRDWSEAPDVIAEQAQLSGREDITRVIYLMAVDARSG